MTKRPVRKANASPTKPSGAALAPLIAEVRGLIQSARRAAATTVNTLQVLTNFEIGRRIVEHEQKGADRASYGEEILKVLSHELTREFGGGFSVTNLKLMRQFFVQYRQRIGQTASDQSPPSVFPNGLARSGVPKGQTASDRSATPTENSSQADFRLSWSHFVLLLSIKDYEERSFYEIEAAAQTWSLRELKRQVAASLYERLALSRDKKGVRKLAAEGQLVTKPEDILKEPYVLEFLGLDEKTSYSESDLEQAIIDRIEHFLLELGKGFLFESRQRRFTFDEDHFYVDLVFYNRLLRCYVLLDLKLDKLSHQDLGQMQMYVNYFDRYVKQPQENPTVGILLCKRKKDAIVELTLPKDANIHAREYKLYLPSKELLKKKLLEWTREQEPKA